MSQLAYATPQSSKHRKLLDSACELAKLSTQYQRHGAIIVKGARVIAVGVNRFMNTPEHVTDPKTQADVHAEVAALNACRKTDLTGATIYVARIARKDDSPAMSKPCVNCQAALKARGVKTVYYTIDGELEL